MIKLNITSDALSAELQQFLKAGAEVTSHVEVELLARYLKNREFIEANGWPRTWRSGEVSLPDAKLFASSKAAAERKSTIVTFVGGPDDC